MILELDSARRKLADLPEVDVDRMAMERLGRLQADTGCELVGEFPFEDELLA